MGFVPGAYNCFCKDGFYFSDKSKSVQAYTGEEIEEYFRQTGNIEDGLFQCVVCAEGCDTCVDDSPCLYSRNEPLMITLLILDLLTVAGIIGIAIATYLYRIELVGKPLNNNIRCTNNLRNCKIWLLIENKMTFALMFCNISNIEHFYVM
jgi:hypothetical protein